MTPSREYQKPMVVDLGSITEHTYIAGNSNNLKGGGPIAHCDKHVEWSGGTDPDHADCTGVENPGAED